MLLRDRVVIVTGAVRGIGASIARVCASHGAAVVVNYANSAEKASGVVQQIAEGGGQAIAVKCDVRDEGEVQRLVAATLQRFGRLDGVVNNAIGGTQHGDFANVQMSDYETAFDFGCRAIVHMTRAAREPMKAQGGGRIVNIVTELWNMAPGGWSVYMAGKGAMVGISRSLACELGPDNITVNMVAPGWMADEKVDTSSDDSLHFAAAVPLRRHGSADEIGNACTFLLSDLASYVTGAYLPVSGGRITQMGS